MSPLWIIVLLSSVLGYKRKAADPSLRSHRSGAGSCVPPAGDLDVLPGDDRQPEPGGWNRLVIEVEDLESEVDSMKRAGLSFRNEVVTGPGGKQILLEDPAGNPVELFEPA
jgi:hypothetical protein